MIPFHCIILCDRKNPSLHVCALCIGIFAFKMTTEIICLQDELPIVVIPDKSPLWISKLLSRDIMCTKIYRRQNKANNLDVLMEHDNRMDKFAVCLKINEKKVGHLKKGKSRRFARTIFYFLLSDAYSSAWPKVTFKRCNLRDGEGM